jgi:predicted  nucleic acid-binding Zn-ribbon protein
MGIFNTAIEIRKLKDRINQEHVKLQDYLGQVKAHNECPYENPMTVDALAAAVDQEALVAELEHNLHVMEEKFKFEQSWMGIQTKDPDYEKWSKEVDSLNDSKEEL